MHTPKLDQTFCLLAVYKQDDRNIIVQIFLSIEYIILLSDMYLSFPIKCTSMEISHLEHLAYKWS